MSLYDLAQVFGWTFTWWYLGVGGLVLVVLYWWLFFRKGSR